MSNESGFADLKKGHQVDDKLYHIYQMVAGKTPKMKQCNEVSKAIFLNLISFIPKRIDLKLYQKSALYPKELIFHFMLYLPVVYYFISEIKQSDMSS